MSENDGDLGLEVPPHRGMIGISMDDDGTICLEHQFTDKTFEFAYYDLDEVIEALIQFRKSRDNQPLPPGAVRWD